MATEDQSTHLRLMAPYLLLSALFLALLVLAALDIASIYLGLLPGLSGATWLRTHFVTIGILGELAFAVITLVIARRRGPRAAQRWEIWLAFHAGLLLLLIGLPMINATLLISGGTLLFIAVTLLFLQLRAARPALSFTIRDGRPFYALSLLYLLLGIFLGTGLWLGWGKYIGLAGPKEVHVHTNLWGFTSLFFAGLFVDLYPEFARRPLAWPRSISAIFWLMTLGALGMVVGPWLQLNLLTSLGLVLHTIATIWLLTNLLKPLRHSGYGRLPGYWHLFSAYLWFFIPVVVAPLIVGNAESLAVGRIEQQGGAILIYGWILPICYTLIPYLTARVFRPAAMPAAAIPLGGSWLSLAAVQGGAALYWLGLLLPDAQAGLHAAAFLLWALSALPILLPLVRLLRHGLNAIVGDGEPLLETRPES